MKNEMKLLNEKLESYKKIMEDDGYEFSKWLFIPYQVAIKLALGVYFKRKNSSSQ